MPGSDTAMPTREQKMHHSSAQPCKTSISMAIMMNRSIESCHFMCYALTMSQFSLSHRLEFWWFHIQCLKVEFWKQHVCVVNTNKKISHVGRASIDVYPSCMPCPIPLKELSHRKSDLIDLSEWHLSSISFSFSSWKSIRKDRDLCKLMWNWKHPHMEWEGLGRS